MVILVDLVVAVLVDHLVLPLVVLVQQTKVMLVVMDIV